LHRALRIRIQLEWPDLEIHAAHAAARHRRSSRAALLGTSAIIASVVIRSEATEAAFWIAARTTLVGLILTRKIILYMILAYCG
jgi:hypothetical protein